MFLHAPAVNLPHSGVAHDAELVKPFVATKNKSRSVAALQHSHNQGYTLDARHTDGVSFRSRRVAERTQDVEDARNSKLCASFGGVSEPWVKCRGKRKDNTYLGKDLGKLLRGKRQVYAQLGEHIR